jgi:hypothetical protein
VVLPVPGGPQKTSEPSERLQHAGQHAIGPEQMVLADHLGGPLGPQPVGERPRRGALEAGGGEQIWGAGGLLRHASKVGVNAAGCKRLEHDPGEVGSGSPTRICAKQSDRIYRGARPDKAM